jgi:hypothetical protein
MISQHGSINSCAGLKAGLDWSAAFEPNAGLLEEGAIAPTLSGVRVFQQSVSLPVAIRS